MNIADTDTNTNTKPLLASELILNTDGSVYHLHLLPEDIADIILTVGDPARVQEVSKYFDRIEVKKQKREFITHTGYFKGKKITVLSTGMSTDNIDIVFNELDALVNIDLKTRLLKNQLKKLNIIRIGTAGGLQENILLDSFVTSEYAIGLDGLADYYKINFDAEENKRREKLLDNFGDEIKTVYAIRGDEQLIKLFSPKTILGTTVTCPGFYGPQGRTLRALPKIDNFAQKLNQAGMANFEMETSGLYAMGRILGHQTCSISVIVANRITGEFSQKAPEAIDRLIQYVLETV